MAAPYETFAIAHPELAARIQAVVDRGRSHLEQGDKTEARKDFQRALALYPHVPAALNNLALLALADGEKEIARAYLDDLLAFDAEEPTAHALLARYWYETGSYPLAARAASAAVASILALSKNGQGNDPTRLRRALQFTYQALAFLAADWEIVRLYENVPDEPLLPPALTHVGLAYFNLGRLAEANALWEKAAGQEFAPARIFLELAAVLAAHELLPFHLDHMLEMPQPEQGRHVWLSHVPTLFLAAAVSRVFQGTAAEVEEALSLTMQAGMPGADRVLKQVAADLTRPVRLRLLACLHLLATGATEVAAQLAGEIAAGEVPGEERALWYLVHGLIAEGEDRNEQAALYAAQGLAELKTGETTPSGQIFAAMLENLAARTGRLAVPAVGAASSGVAAGLQLPDAEWLRQALQGTAATALEAALARKQRAVIDELARRLGETQPGSMPGDALIRRLAVRIRSVQLERVLRLVPAAARELLGWLARAGQPVLLPEVAAKVASLEMERPAAQKAGAQTDLWSILEALFRAGLVDVGFLEAHSPGTPVRAEQVAVLVPADLQSRLAGLAG